MVPQYPSLLTWLESVCVCLDCFIYTCVWVCIVCNGVLIVSNMLSTSTTIIWVIQRQWSTVESLSLTYDHLHYSYKVLSLSFFLYNQMNFLLQDNEQEELHKISQHLRLSTSFSLMGSSHFLYSRQFLYLYFSIPPFLDTTKQWLMSFHIDS